MKEEAIESTRKRQKRWSIVTAFLIIALLVSFYISIRVGPIDIGFFEILETLLGRGTELNRKVIWELRAPRAVMASFVGAGLAISGVGMQALFRNPMASPYILGLSSGAAFGAALAIVLGLTVLPGNFGLPSMAFISCFITLMIVYGIARGHGRIPVETLLLAGIAVGSFFSALVSLLTYLARDELADIVYWMMGDVSQYGWTDVRVVMPLIMIGSVMIFFYARDLNAMMLGDNHAMNLGIDVPRVRLMTLLACALVTASAVSFVGIIGFVGLIIPHIVRILIGPDHRILIPASMIGGAAFLVTCDVLSRIMFYPMAIPIGIITSLIGAPYFIYLLKRRRREIGW